MSEQLPEDMGSGIPPIRGKSMFDLVLEREVVAAAGVHIDDVEVGQTIHYVNGPFRYYVTKQAGHGVSHYMLDKSTTYPIVTTGRTDIDGVCIEETTGLFLGISLTGDGNCPMPYLPRDGEAFRTVLIESLPTPSHPDSLPRLMLFKGLPEAN